MSLQSSLSYSDSLRGIVGALSGFFGIMPYQKVVLACFDESGKLNDSEVVAFGGCVALPETFGALTRAWESRIKADGLPHTSMKEAMNFQGPYTAWKDAPTRRDAVVRDLAKLIVDASMYRIVSPIKTAEFKKLPQDFRKKFRNDPHYAGFEACVLGVLHSRLDIGVHIMCDLAEEYSEKCVSLFHLIRKRNPDAKDRCLGIGFADDEVNGPLQAADMIAFCARAHAIRETVSPQPIVQELIEMLHSKGLEEHSVLYRIDGKGLGDGTFEVGSESA